MIKTWKREDIPEQLSFKKGETRYKLDCGTELTANQLIKMTGWSNNTVYKRLNSVTDWEELTRPLKRTRTKDYLLSDGTTITAPQLSKLVGCTNSTACLRLQKSNDRAVLTRPLACLLYTSPSPRDLSTSRMPSSA